MNTTNFTTRCLLVLISDWNMSSRTSRYPSVNTHQTSRTSNKPSVNTHQTSRTSNKQSVNTYQSSRPSNYPSSNVYQTRRTSKYPSVNTHQSSWTSHHPSVNTHQTSRTSTFHSSHAAKQTDCLEKYSAATTGHSACLQRSHNVNGAGISEADKSLIVDTHNKVRRDVYSASNMRELTWDADIAGTAQRWAEHCQVGPDARYKRYSFGRFPVGQNLAWDSRTMDWHVVLNRWSSGIKSFSYGRKHNVGVVGMYTQMVWAETSKIGCGYANCGDMNYYICNYGPAGNSNISKPYTYGPSCGDCPSTCNNKLCDCRGRVCLNGGTMDLNTCQCTCNQESKFYIQPDCRLNCTGIQDPTWCRRYGPAGCERYANIPVECPDMCRWCPAAGVKGFETGASAWPDEGFKTPTVDKTDKQVKTKSKSADGHRKVGTSAWPDEGFKTPTVDTTDKQVRKTKSKSADGHRKEPDGRQKYVYIKQVKGRKTYEIEGQSKGQLAPTSPNCSVKYATIVVGHSACSVPSRHVKRAGVSNVERSLILDTHNRIRMDVYSARDMQLLTWDTEIALTAQRWSENCKVESDNPYQRYAYGRFAVGQNLIWSTGDMGWPAVIGRWSSQVKRFHYGQADNVAAVEYAQIVSAETSKIGCGYADCGNMHYYVCNYGLASSLDISKPYTYGPACGDCPSTCNDKLCDCGGRVCLNGGTMDLHTCRCTCNMGLRFYTQPDCALNCTDIRDPAWCSQYALSDCETYVNVPQECPRMCNWCPAAGVEPPQVRPVSGTRRLQQSTITVLIISVINFIFYTSPRNTI